MSQCLRVFHVYVKRDESSVDPLGFTRFVKDGWSWRAAVAGLFIASIVLGIFEKMGVMGVQMASVLQFGAFLYTGLAYSDWLGMWLTFRGYRLYDVVCAEGEMRAKKYWLARSADGPEAAL